MSCTVKNYKIYIYEIFCEPKSDLIKDKNYDFEIVGGIAEYEYPNWKINSKNEYIYENRDDWVALAF